MERAWNQWTDGVMWHSTSGNISLPASHLIFLLLHTWQWGKSHLSPVIGVMAVLRHQVRKILLSSNQKMIRSVPECFFFCSTVPKTLLHCAKAHTQCESAYDKKSCCFSLFQYGSLKQQQCLLLHCCAATVPKVYFSPVNLILSAKTVPYANVREPHPNYVKV